MTRYQSGVALERAARIELAANGYEVIRSAGSKTVVDLVAFKAGEMLFVQCKTDGYLAPAERAELRRVAGLVGAQPLACGWFKDGRAARVLAFRYVGQDVAGKAVLSPWSPDFAVELDTESDDD